MRPSVIGGTCCYTSYEDERRVILDSCVYRSSIFVFGENGLEATLHDARIVTKSKEMRQRRPNARRPQRRCCALCVLALPGTWCCGWANAWLEPGQKIKATTPLLRGTSFGTHN
ncbi:hypothetical protein ACQKWADRAFT_53484 [Trichoderma austrokoningii]